MRKRHINYNMKRNALLLFLSLISTAILAQTGSIKGTVKDAKTGEVVIGATVLVVGSNPPIGAATDPEGNFEIKRAPLGEQKVQISYISYKPKVVNVSVFPNQTVVVNTSLEDESTQLAEVKVVSQRSTQTDVSVITEIKQIEQIAVGISGQQISRSLDRDASQVIRRVPGVSIQDDRFVIVRGLAERYNTVLLNDAITPSTEVDTRSFSFDLIPSATIDRMLIFKSGAPDLPGDFGGGAIKIFTKTVPDGNGFTFGLSTSYRSNTTFQNLTTHQGGKLDWLGIDDGKRSLPAGLPSSAALTANTTPTDVTISAFRQWEKYFDIRNKSAMPDLRANLGFSRRLYLGSKQLTNFTNVSYTNSRTFAPIEQFRYQGYDAATQQNERFIQYNDQSLAENSRIGVLSNFALILNPTNRIEFRNLFNQLSSKETVVRQGINLENDFSDQRNYSFRFESRSLYSGQLNGTHEIGANNTLKWLGGFSYIHRDEPDFRRFITSRRLNSNDPYQVETLPRSGASLQRAARFYSNLDETATTGRVDYEHRIQKGSQDDEKMQIKLRAGAYVEYKDRIFKARWFNLVNTGNVGDDVLRQSPEQVFDASNIAANRLYYEEKTNPDDRYDAQNLLTAGYVGAYIPLSRKFNATLGFRGEYNRQQLQSRQRGSGQPIVVDNPIFSPLPSLNVAYNLNDKSLIRFAYSMTVNRPEFRELAPFTYYDFIFDVSRVGNPDLQTATIQNLDARYEIYPKDGELISLAAFYKSFKNPIEASIRYSGSGISYYFRNAQSAYTAGLELEARKSLKGVTSSKFIDNTTVVLNAALIQSDVTTGFVGQENNRPLQGQSPYLVNAGLYYNDVDRGLQVNALYNVYGRRIFQVGDNDIQPTIYEMPRNVIDLNVIKSLGQRFELRLGIQDLLNQRLRLVQDTNLDQKIDSSDDTYQSLRRGTYTTLGITYRL